MIVKLLHGVYLTNIEVNDEHNQNQSFYMAVISNSVGGLSVCSLHYGHPEVCQHVLGTRSGCLRDHGFKIEWFFHYNYRQSKGGIRNKMLFVMGGVKAFS